MIDYDVFIFNQDGFAVVQHPSRACVDRWVWRFRIDAVPEDVRVQDVFFVAKGLWSRGLLKEEDLRHPNVVCKMQWSELEQLKEENPEAYAKPVREEEGEEGEEGEGGEAAADAEGSNNEQQEE